jgi:hypothetical protein
LSPALFGGKILHPSSRSKSKQSKKLAERGGKKQDFLGLFFDLEDGGDIFFQKDQAFSDRHGVITQKPSSLKCMVQSYR